MEKAGKDIQDEDLAEAMAGKGLGTPATRVDTIEKITVKRIHFKTAIRCPQCYASRHSYHRTSSQNSSRIDCFAGTHW